MKLKSLTLLLIAGGCGLVAMLGVQQMLSGKKADAAEEMVNVLIATGEIPAGIPLDETNVRFRPMPKSAVPEGVVTRPEEYKDRALKVQAVTNETIMLAKLGQPGIMGPSIEIPPGMRVVTVPCNTTMVHAGMLRPGDRVDILLTYQSNEFGGQKVTKTRTVLEYIKVFATDDNRNSQRVDAEDGGIAKNISFLVDPDDANLLKLAENKGSLSLSLRSQLDDVMVEGLTKTEADLDDDWGKGLSDDEARRMLLGDGSGTVDNLFSAEADIAETVAVEVAEPIAPTWQIKIFAGGEQRVEEVALPLNDTHNETSSGSTKPGAGGWLQKLFLGT